MALLEVIAAFSEMTDGYPETMFDDILVAYDEDISAPIAQIAELEAAAATAAAESAGIIAGLKSANYDLLIASGAGVSDNAGGGTGTEEVEESDAGIMPEDLFGEKKNKEED